MGTSNSKESNSLSHSDHAAMRKSHSAKDSLTNNSKNNRKSTSRTTSKKLNNSSIYLTDDNEYFSMLRQKQKMDAEKHEKVSNQEGTAWREL